MILWLLASSSAMYLSNSAADLHTMPRPALSIKSLYLGFLYAFSIDFSRIATILSGVFLGTRTPLHTPKVQLIPCSLSVGTFGKM